MDCDRKLCKQRRGEASLAAGPAPAAWTRLFPPSPPRPSRGRNCRHPFERGHHGRVVGSGFKLSSRTGRRPPSLKPWLVYWLGVCVRGARPRPRNAGLVHAQPTLARGRAVRTSRQTRGLPDHACCGTRRRPPLTSRHQREKQRRDPAAPSARRISYRLWAGRFRRRVENEVGDHVNPEPRRGVRDVRRAEHVTSASAISK
jgi:hypothetical protein